jgi:Cu2+-exporting ATPase
VELANGVTVVHNQRRIRVREYNPHGDRVGPLVVEIDGTTVALIHFEQSTRFLVADALRDIRDRAGVPAVLVSGRSESDVAALASRLGLSHFVGSCSPEEESRFLRACGQRGLRTALITHASNPDTAAAVAEVTIALTEDGNSQPRWASVIVPHRRWDALAELWGIAAAHEGRVRDAQTFVFVPNVLCVAGAFLFGFTGLAAVIITNVGTFSLYSKAVGSLRALEPAGTARPLDRFQRRIPWADRDP